MLQFYIWSTAISLFVAFITVIALGARLRREGLKSPNKHSMAEVIHTLLIFFVPIVNIGVAWVCLAYADEIYEKTKAKMILKGSE